MGPRLRSVALLAILFSFYSHAPVRAQSPEYEVTQEDRPMRTGAYQSAAKDAGFTEWGDALDCRQTAHVFLRVNDPTLRLTIGVPPDISPPVATTSLQKLAAELGMTRRNLVFSIQKDALFLRADFDGDWSGRQPRRLDFDLALLQRRVSELSDRPALLGVNVTSGDVLNVTPPPAAKGHSALSQVLFFRLTPGIGALSLTMGLPPRVFAALSARETVKPLDTVILG